MEKVTCQRPEKCQSVDLSRSCQEFIARLSPLRGKTALGDNVPSGAVGSCQDPAFPL